MFGLNSLGIKNIGVLESCNITDLSEQGFVAIQGRNLDSQAINGNTNACGKSLLFSTLPVVLFEAEPLALNKNTKSKFLSKTGKLDLNWTSPSGKVVEISQTASKYKVTIDGEDQKVDRQDVAKAIIAENFPLSREEFYSFAYLNSYLAHPFQQASKADRMKYITSVFKLDLYDRLKAVFLQKLNAAKDAESVVATQASVLDGVNVKLTKLDFKDDEKKAYRKLQKEIDSLSSTEKDLQKRARKLSVDLNVSKSAESLQASLKELPKAIRAVLKVNKEIDKLRGWIEDINETEAYEAALAEYEARKKKLDKQLSKLKRSLNGETSIKAIQKAHGALVEEEDELKEKLTAAQDAIDEFTAKMDEIAELDKQLSFISKPKLSEADIEDLETYAKSFIKIYNRLHDHEGSECPTCGSDIDMKKLETQYKKAKKDLALCEEASNYYDLESQLDKARKDLKTIWSDGKPDPKEVKRIQKKLSALSEKLDALEAQYAVLEEYSEVQAKLKALKKPKANARPKHGSVKELRNQVEDLRTRQRLEDALAELKVPSKPYKKIKRELQDCESELAKIRKKMNRLADSTRDYKVRSTEHRVLNAQRVELEDKIAELQPVIDAKKVAECMYKAYGANNLKSVAVAKVLQRLQEQMNAYSHLVFPEPMHFEFEIEPTGISALVTRMISGRTSDIYSLSGAETNCFRLLWAISILPFVPDSHRPNFMILDEPDNSCSPAVREHLIREFLPVLRDVVPNVYWITPQNADLFDDATIWTVVKQDGKSTLEIS